MNGPRRVFTGRMKILTGRSRARRDGDGGSDATNAEETGESSIFDGRLKTFNAFAIPHYRLLWLGMLFSMGAMQMNIISRSWLAYHISGSGLAIGLVALGRGLPQFLLAPIGGAAADRFDKRKLLIFSQFSLVVLSLANAVLVQLHVIQIWQLIVLGVVQGIIFPFTMPTRTAYIADVVDESRFANALALDSTGRNLNRVIAPVSGRHHDRHQSDDRVLRHRRLLSPCRADTDPSAISQIGAGAFAQHRRRHDARVPLSP